MATICGRNRAARLRFAGAGGSYPAIYEDETGMWKAIGAGVVYAAAVFGLAFLTGALRTVVVATFGLPPVAGVIVELPLLLLAAWVICGLVAARMQVSVDPGVRILMAVTALIVMLSAEFALSALVIGRSLPQFLASYERPEAMLGLVGQLVFAAFPVIEARRTRG